MTATEGEPEAALPHPYFGRTIARCRVGERVGRGATSSVCRAHYEALDKDIAIKILTGEHADQLRENFLAEARAVAKVDHENVVKVFDVVEDGGCTCILMEYIDGETLQDLLDDKGALPPAKALRVAQQIARALEAAHAEKIVHRDVKPGNVMLQKGSEQVKMVDFGLAGPKDLANRAGTPLYMSPEACQGKRIDEKSDVYALGVCLYQMLTGKLPFGGKSVKQILAAHVKGEYTPPGTVLPKLTSKYDDLVKKLLVTSKGYRPTAGEAAEMIEPLLAESAIGAKAGGGRRGAGRRPAAGKKDGPPTGVIVGSIIAVVVIVIVLVAAMSGGKKEQDATPAETPAQTDPTSTGLRNGTGGQTTPVKDPIEEEYEKAYLAAKKADEDNAAKAKVWKAFLAKHAQGEFADKAKEHLDKAEQEAKRDEELAAQRKKTEELNKQRIADRKEIDEKEKACDFAGAAFLAIGDKKLPDERVDEWRLKKRRITWLGEELGDAKTPRFAQRMNEALEAMEPKVAASKVKPGEGEQWELVGATRTGFVGDSAGIQREYPFSDVAPEAVFDVAVRCISQTDVDGNLFLAVLGVEFGEATGDEALFKRGKSYVELAQLVDATGDAKKKLLYFFPSEWLH